MSQDSKADRLKFWVEWTYRVFLALLVLASLYLKSNFAAHDEVKVVSDRVTRIETSIAIMVEQNKINDRQDHAIEDHESRIRELEHRK